MRLYVEPCHVASAKIAVAMSVPIQNPADCEVRGVIRFLYVDEILSYPAEEVSSRGEFFCCMTMHVRILPGRYKSCCVNNSIGKSSSILHTFRTWYCRTSSFSVGRCDLRLFCRRGKLSRGIVLLYENERPHTSR